MLTLSVLRIFPFTTFPLIWVSKSEIEGATYSITPAFSASWPSRFLFLVITSSAKVSFLTCLLAVVTEYLIRALIIFPSSIGFVPSTDICTGCAEPITVKGAIAAISVPIRIKVPADQAFPPSGTYPITGTVVFLILFIIACVSSSPPPGVSRLITRASKPSFSAFAIALAMTSSEAGVMAPEILSTSTLLSDPAPATWAEMTIRMEHKNKTKNEHITLPISMFVGPFLIVAFLHTLSTLLLFLSRNSLR